MSVLRERATRGQCFELCLALGRVVYAVSGSLTLGAGFPRRRGLLLAPYFVCCGDGGLSVGTWMADALGSV
ncbi:hypothetical protein GCM10010331_16410 [Streptomyces xanthochromogenes]|nr:hypothetical protein GCM10010331_16410 [Streptomyces xanthochromogenes]